VSGFPKKLIPPMFKLGNNNNNSNNNNNKVSKET
jgi:hypothetical protein